MKNTYINKRQYKVTLKPIVVDNVDQKSELVIEETFGPIIPIVRVPDNYD